MTPSGEPFMALCPAPAAWCGWPGVRLVRASRRRGGSASSSAPAAELRKALPPALGQGEPLDESRQLWPQSPGLSKPGAERRQAGQVLYRYDVRLSDTEQTINTLSGGNQQKVVIAPVARDRAAGCVVEEPTAGIDVGAKAQIYRILEDALGRGLGGAYGLLGFRGDCRDLLPGARFFRAGPDRGRTQQAQCLPEHSPASRRVTIGRT